MISIKSFVTYLGIDNQFLDTASQLSLQYEQKFYLEWLKDMRSLLWKNKSSDMIFEIFNYDSIFIVIWWKKKEIKDNLLKIYLKRLKNNPLMRKRKELWIFYKAKLKILKVRHPASIINIEVSIMKNGLD